MEEKQRYLYDALKEYCRTNAYPMHMPGHKRMAGGMQNLYQIDITEIDGFDNLHHAEGILKEAQQRAAALYGSSDTFFLVNGSTCGILASITACVMMAAGRGRKPKILMARNCHKAAYHAVMINQIEALYLYPEQISEYQLNGRIRPEDVAAELERDPDICCVLITSPSYDGVVSDVKRIAQTAHQHGVPLIVDEAHGAHFGFHPAFPENSVKLGADLVIHSLHKTLPSLTQTALLHRNGTLVSAEQVQACLGVYETSSPSYVLMASMDECVRMMNEFGQKLFDDFVRRLDWFSGKAADWKHLFLIRTDDPSKLVIACRLWDGLKLTDWFRKEAGIEMEMAAGNYALALTTIADTKEGFDRLEAAAKKLDEELDREWRLEQENREKAVSIRVKHRKTEAKKTIYEAVTACRKQICLEASRGMISAEWLYLYPPGIPLLIPGEVIDGELLEQILQYREQGYSLQGLQDFSMQTIGICEENVTVQSQAKFQ